MNRKKENNANNVYSVGNFHSQPMEKVLKDLSSDANGLSSDEAGIRLKKYGPNEILEKKARNPVIVFLRQFNSALIYILMVAAAISFLFDRVIDAYVIIAVIILNAVVGFIQERKAEHSIQALKKLIVPTAKVYRDRSLVQIPAKDLVPGDIILLEEGDRIPADARLVEAKNFRTVEASLTGESFPVEKDIKVLHEKIVLADCRNMVWMGTFVAGGQAKAVVTGTGTGTAIGMIARKIEEIKKEKSHFERKTEKLGKQMAIIAIISAALTFVVGFFIRGFGFAEIFLFAVASLVSAIPEGLPAVLVILLAIGAHRMAKRNAIIRNLPATETLGVVTVIVTDKTGTLTENTMNVEKVMLPEQEEITVSGVGWEPSGAFSQKGKMIIPLENPGLSKLLHIACVCNNARLLKDYEKNSYEIIGDPTEASLLVLAEKAGLKKEALQGIEKRIKDDLPFSSELKYRASISSREGGKEIYAVGAPETILKRCASILENGSVKKLTEKERKKVLHQVEHLSRKAMRVIALAYRSASEETESLSDRNVKNLIFAGMAGMMDPPRPEVKDAVAKAKKAGIRVIMATGDHKTTAIAVAKEIGLIEKPKDGYPEALTEQELLKLSKKEFGEMISNVSIFARLTPTMKLRIAETLQKQGHVVAMTGDGVNDAPALKKADIGISMGVIGTDVARESSEIVLADDNFASIVNAIEEGRIVFINTRQSSFFLVTTHFAENIAVLGALFLGFHLPLLPTQILWLNLVTDSISGVTLSTEPGHGDVLDEPPRKANEEFLSREILPFLILETLVVSAAILIVFTSFLPEGLDKARTVVFAMVALTQLFNFLNMRSLKKSIFEIGFFSNRFAAISIAVSIALLFLVLYTPFFQGVFHFVSLSLIELAEIAVISSFVLWAGEIYKFLRK